ncbi:hypothetical protein, partial [Tsukamurella sp. 1534]|uniref:hypothetical protein n=1 Tax=Tsukamurella sp. 1534 TaxID=1151061 RepID=UPI000592AB13
MTAALVAGQDPAGAVAVAERLGGAAATVGADGALTPVAGIAEEFTAAVYVLDACVPADAVDEEALARLRARCGVVVVATGADVYPDAAAVRAESARRLRAEVLPVEPAAGTGFDAVRA